MFFILLTHETEVGICIIRGLMNTYELYRLDLDYICRVFDIKAATAKL